MQKWEFQATAVFISDRVGATANATRIWTEKDKQGKSRWDEISSYGKDGWELVNATPIDWNGTTQQVLFTFKRPLKTE